MSKGELVGSDNDDAKVIMMMPTITKIDAEITLRVKANMMMMMMMPWIAVARSIDSE